jgi:hypothetical protein
MNINHNEYLVLRLHENRAAELRREAELARLAASVPRPRRPARADGPWWRRLRRSREIRRARLA